MSRSRLIRLVLVFFLAGIVAGELAERSVYAGLFWIVVLSGGFSGAVFAMFMLSGVRRRVPGIGRNVVLFVIIGFIIGCIRSEMVVRYDSYDDIRSWGKYDKKITVEGMISREPDLRSDSQHLVLSVENVTAGGRTAPCYGRLLVKANRYPDYSYGDYLKVTGIVKIPASLEGFDYAAYLAKEGIYATMYSPWIDSGGRRFDGLNLLFSFKDAVARRTADLFSGPAAGLVGGLLLGLRSGVPADMMDDFNRAGLTHILAISGYNITMVIGIVATLAGGCGRRLRVFLTLGAIFFFSLLTGMGASVVRAALMGGLVVTAGFIGRKSAALNILLMSAAIMAQLNPRIILNDISFQLSFLSTLGLILMMPHIEKYTKVFPPFIGEGFGVTLASQVFTIPITLLNFGRFSLISPVSNVIFLPLVPLIMAGSFCALVVSFVLFPLGLLAAAITCVPVGLLFFGVHLIVQIPFSSVDIGWFGLPHLIFYYLSLSILLSTNNRQL